MHTVFSSSQLEVSIIATGGTIEKIYDEARGNLENKGSVIQRQLFNKLRLPYTNVVFEDLMSKDSLEMTKEDRRLICQAVEKRQEKKQASLILHGTDTMLKSACYCLDHIKKLTAPVIFTGAMRPLGFSDSDAWQNVVEALLLARIAPIGVHISFHSCLFDPRKARKNIAKATFEAI